MLSEEVIDKVIERLTRRIEKTNIYILEEIGKSINKIGALTPTQAYQLIQIMRYGGDYDKIIKEITKLTKLNVKDIYSIFEEVAKSDYEFAKQFYEYRKMKYIPYEENTLLKTQVQAIAKMTAETYINLTNSMAFAKIVDGKKVYSPLGEVYNDILDKAVLSMAQGKTTFDKELHKSIKELASNGIRSVDYESGRSIRLDSAVRMNMKDALRTLHNETQMIFGQEFGSDGVEISVHLNPAPDHQDVQGKQFSTNKYNKKGKLIKQGEYEKLQETGHARTYDGIEVDLHRELKSGQIANSFRPISEYNCYHITFPIILGVSEQEYTNEQLKEIIEKNDEGFEFDGKHYSNYEGTQLQRRLELEIRKWKDQQIIGVASGDTELIDESQKMISQLSKKYKDLSNASGLPTKAKRMQVSGYKRVAIK